MLWVAEQPLSDPAHQPTHKSEHKRKSLYNSTRIHVRVSHVRIDDIRAVKDYFVQSTSLKSQLKNY